MECRYCSALCNKKGIRHGSQQYRCKSCGTYQKSRYRYKSYTISDETIKMHIKEGVGIRSMARLLDISQNTVIRRIVKIASAIKKPPIPKKKNLRLTSSILLYEQKKNQPGS